jgi:hypothetical protein
MLGAAMKGDRVEIVIDAGEGTRTYEVSATRAGRRVEIANRRGVTEVSEVTRTGTQVRIARFMSSRVVALVEYPAEAGPAADGRPARRAAGPAAGD